MRLTKQNCQGYHQFKSGDTQHGSFEVFYVNKKEATQNECLEQAGYGNCPEPGWYWWACFPGCLPDGEPTGPFVRSIDAYKNAQEMQNETD